MSQSTASILASTALARQPSPIDSVDPRARVLAAVAFSGVAAVCHQFVALGLALAIAVGGMLLARLCLGPVLRRLMPLNLLLLLLTAVLPWTTPGTPLVSLGPAVYSREGLLLVATIALKGNAIVLALVVLLGTLDVTTLGHALSHLYVPEKLTHLLLFTVRYLEVLEREYLRLTAAMRMRGFRPGVNLHTYRTYGYLVGMLLVRSLERSQRVVAAMKCRGFHGRFYLLDHFAFTLHDVRFGMVSLILLLGMALVEWLGPVQ
jgi:cobalt/nickel transport system permease protein